MCGSVCATTSRRHLFLRGLVNALVVIKTFRTKTTCTSVGACAKPSWKMINNNRMDFAEVTSAAALTRKAIRMHRTDDDRVDTTPVPRTVYKVTTARDPFAVFYFHYTIHAHCMCVYNFFLLLPRSQFRTRIYGARALAFHFFGYVRDSDSATVIRNVYPGSVLQQ